MFPELSVELEQLLRVSGEHALAEQIPELHVLDRCRCRDDFCATFYTQPKPKGLMNPGCGRWLSNQTLGTSSSM
jgi:hypothetical protein